MSALSAVETIAFVELIAIVFLVAIIWAMNDMLRERDMDKLVLEGRIELLEAHQEKVAEEGK
jgi:hypothetical protein